MDCKRFLKRLELFLTDALSAEENARFESHLEECTHCQSIPVLDPELTRLLREKLPRAEAGTALRSRILAALPATAAVEALEPLGLARVQPWYERFLGSSWTPRLAMAAVLLLLLLVPLSSFFRAPALALVAAERHECHLVDSANGPLPCCEELGLAPGDALGEPSKGAVVPDLSSYGLELEISTRCTFKGQTVNVLAFRSSESETFSLYITDRVTEEFEALRTDADGGVVQASYPVRENEVTIWERNSLVYFWVGQPRSPHYDLALAGLQAP